MICLVDSVFHLLNNWGLANQWISIRETNCAIQWIEIYPLDSAIHLLNNWGLEIRIAGSSGHLQQCDCFNRTNILSLFLVLEATSPPLKAHSSSTTMTPFTDQGT